MIGRCRWVVRFRLTRHSLPLARPLALSFFHRRPRIVLPTFFVAVSLSLPRSVFPLPSPLLGTWAIMPRRRRQRAEKKGTREHNRRWGEKESENERRARGKKRNRMQRRRLLEDDGVTIVLTVISSWYKLDALRASISAAAEKMSSISGGSSRATILGPSARRERGKVQFALAQGSYINLRGKIRDK